MQAGVEPRCALLGYSSEEGDFVSGLLGWVSDDPFPITGADLLDPHDLSHPFSPAHHPASCQRCRRAQPGTLPMLGIEGGLQVLASLAD